MTRILVTGARGFIGSNLARHLVKSGHTVCGLGHGQWPEPSARAAGVWPWMNSDVTAASLRLLRQSFGIPDVVFHLAGGSSVGAALANPREDFARTVVSTAELLEWVRQDSPVTRVIVVSSAAVYGAGHVGRITESSILAPFSPYGHHKRMMEQLCISYADSFGINVRIARLFSVYGAGLRKQLLWDLCTRLGEGAPQLRLGGCGEEIRDWIHVRDVARALEHVMELAGFEDRVVNVGTGIGTPVRQIAAAIATQWAQSGSPVGIEFNGESRAGDPFSLVAQTNVLAESGFEWAVKLEWGLADYVCWYRGLLESSAWA